MRVSFRKILILLAVLLVAFQFVPVVRENPAEHTDPAIPAEVLAILRQSCFDCHSNRTRWPWYSKVAPVSWLVADDVEEGREHLNLSLWNDLSPVEQANTRAEIWDHVSEGEMPLPIYLYLHRDARLDDAALEILRGWAGGDDEGDHEH